MTRRERRKFERQAQRTVLRRQMEHAPWDDRHPFVAGIIGTLVLIVFAAVVIALVTGKPLF